MTRNRQPDPRLIDKPLRPYIKALNSLPGIRTSACCSGHPDRLNELLKDGTIIPNDHAYILFDPALPPRAILVLTTLLGNGNILGLDTNCPHPRSHRPRTCVTFPLHDQPGFRSALAAILYAATL